ncbi:MAG: 5'-methylthioadenosine/adenosylhomocysteine nucleosidase [Lachnospiraceae bacterium]|nr:5'-methylthioadenosine/adenosylhomocysteine nucleosidase [Lachnospiraceae bacterium]
MRRIGIISAMWIEVELLHSKMTDVEEVKHAGMKYYKGKLENVDVVLSTCSIGKVNAAIYTQVMIDHFNVDAIIHTGIAGSMDENVKHLSVVVADGLTYYDVRKEQLKNWFPNQEVFQTDQTLRNILKECAGADARCGLILTGDDFISSAERKAELKKRYPALCVEMEGCAVAHAAYVNGIPFGVIRCISDLADGDATEDYSGFEQKAAVKASEIVQKTLRRIALIT